MAAILVDYENVAGKNGLQGLEFLCPKDILYIFYSNSCEKIGRALYTNTLQSFGRVSGTEIYRILKKAV